MKNIFFIMVGLFGLTGCASAQPGTSPETTHAIVQHKEVTMPEAVKVMDDRGNKKARTIGATVIQTNGNNLVELVTDHFIKYINDKARLNVVKVAIKESDVIEEVVDTYKLEGMAILKIKELRVFSIDAFIQPVEVDLLLELSIFDKSGQKIYNRTISGHHEERIGLIIVENNVENLVEIVLKDALNQYGKDPELKKIIMKFKLGSIANFFNMI